MLMASILNIETSTKVCSLALSVNGDVVFEQANFSGSSHASHLGVYALQSIEYARKNELTIDAVAVSSGPGSYTGLRIGVSEAKGLCYGLGIPLIAIPTLKIMTSALLSVHRSSLADHYLCPMIDARRMEVYASLYDMNLNEIRPVQADIIDEDSYKEYLEQQPVVFFGDGSGKCKSVITSPNALFVDNIHPLATAMVDLAEDAFNRKEFVDTAYFEPFYLKEFQATIAKNKVICFNP